MNPKTNLNNTQRKMLNQMYQKKLEMKIAEFRRMREDGKEALNEKVIADFVKANPSAQRMLDAHAEYRERYKELADKLREAGLEVGNLYDGTLTLRRRTHYYGDNSLPAIAEYDEETNKKEAEMLNLRDEITLKIYGAEVSAKDIEKDINDLLKGF